MPCAPSGFTMEQQTSNERLHKAASAVLEVRLCVRVWGVVVGGWGWRRAERLGRNQGTGAP
jgi:hypothetical protein